MGRIRVVLDRLGPRPQTARRFAPAIETPLRAYGARRRVPIGRYLFVKGENPPFHTFPRTRRQRTEFAAICFFRAQLTAAHTRWCRRQGNADLRSASRGSAKPAPTPPPPANLTATNPRIANRTESRGAWSAGLRPASRGSAKPAPTTPPPANLTATNPRIANRTESRGHGAPVSDRHRAGARNPPHHHHPPPISRLQTHASPTAQNHGDMERRSPTGIARERETRTDDAAPRQSHGHEPTHRQPHRITGSVERRSPTGIARERETRPNDPTPRQSHGWSAGLRPASRGSAKPAPTTPLPTLTRVPPPAARFPGC